VRHHAKMEGIDINQVPGTGKGGRVTKEDLINFKAGRTSAHKATEAPKAAVHAPAPSDGQPSARHFKIAPLTGITEKDQ
jgi:pyruvate dehydrogenase E2 component (dihydrolipoamide acetyltransferase)